MIHNEETKNISLIANSEAKGILKELEVQEEKLIEIQRVSGEGKGLLFVNQGLIESARKGAGARMLVGGILLVFVVFFGALAKIKYF